MLIKMLQFVFEPLIDQQQRLDRSPRIVVAKSDDFINFMVGI